MYQHQQLIKNRYGKCNCPIQPANFILSHVIFRFAVRSKIAKSTVLVAANVAGEKLPALIVFYVLVTVHPCIIL